MNLKMFNITLIEGRKIDGFSTMANYILNLQIFMAKYCIL